MKVETYYPETQKLRYSVFCNAQKFVLMHDAKAKCMYVSKVYGNEHCTHTYKEINQFMCIELLKYIKLKKKYWKKSE